MNKPRGWLALDVGTHAVRAGVVLADGHLASLVQRPLALHRLDEHRVEQDPEQIVSTLHEVIAQVSADKSVVLQGAGLACQRSTVVAWQRDTGRALSPALSWQDTRGWRQVEALHARQADIRMRSGLVLSPHYGASKLHHLQVQHAHQRGLCLSPLVTYLLNHLLRQRPHVCDEGNAGRTQLWNLSERRWDPYLLERFAVEPRYLPQVLPTFAPYGELRQVPIPLQAVAGDQNAALCGTLAIDQHERVLANLGSGAFVLTFSGDGQPPDGLLGGLAYSTTADCRRIWEGTVNGAGLALSWLAGQPHIREKGGEDWLFAQLPAWLDDHELLREPVIFHNLVGGLGSPFWRSGGEVGFAPAVIDPARQAVALVESIGFLVAINIARLRAAKPSISTICVTGGLARLDGLCQRLADLLQLPVVRLTQPEATMVGCARMASAFAVPLTAAEEQRFEPGRQPDLERRFRVFGDWLSNL